jgi:uncharacterized repeat protein (TIGR01451 family)
VKTKDLRQRTPSGLLVLSLLLIATLLVLSPSSALDTPSSQEDPPGAEWKEWETLPPRIQAKVDPRILAELRGEAVPAHLDVRPDRAPLTQKETPPARTRFLVTLRAQADLEKVQARARATGQTGRQALVQQRTMVVDALIETARATQGPVKALLDARVASGDATAYFPYYIVNGLAVEGNLATVIALARREDVLHITANYRLVQFKQQGANAPRSLPSAAAPGSDTGAPGNSIGGLDPANWNVDMIDAERVWNELSVDGRGAVVADFDTGVDWDHAALKAQYRGWNGVTANHNYNWFEFDAQNPSYWNTGGDYGPSASTVPYDCSDHGTHTMGTMVGDGGTPSTQIGVAPGAQWIAVPGICGRTMPDGYADDIGGIRTFQWLMCPTDLSGDLSTRDCSKAPDVINNSWGSSSPADDTFRPIVQALRAAGIVPVFASGNPSAGLGSIGTPASIPEAIAVGATDSNDVVTSFSGRGPSFYEGVQKPELSAPGSIVRSSIPGDGYANFGGTSMAAPHVSGLIALMVSADLQDGQRDLNVDELQAFMQYSAVDLGPPGPDDEYGYGRIDAYRAVRWVLSAGDLQGTVRDANTQAPIDGARMTGVDISTGDRFVARADAGGVYSATVPGGTYDVRVEAFGYVGKTFAGVTVLTGTDTLVDFALAPLPTQLLTGQVRSTTPVSDARVYVDARPGLSYTTRADGVYALRLPAGRHDITVEAAGYRIAKATVTIGDANVSHSFDLRPAPTILLVEADGYRGWFSNRPARNFFRYALDARGFLYDTHIVTDQASPPDLAPYDIVIWAHTYGSPGVSGPQTIDALTRYLDGGGRLILSGQDIGRWDGAGEAYYAGYLHAQYRISSASRLGGTVSGKRFLAGMDLTLNEAALYDYPNTALSLSPDGVAPLDGNAYSVLTYDSGQGDAALAIDPCDQSFRAVYLAVGYENLGPRAYDRPPEYADLLERSIEWVTQSKNPYDVTVSVTPIEQMSRAGARVLYGLTIANTGRLPDTYQVSLSGSVWQTQIYSGSTALPPMQTIALAPCSQQDLAVEVDVPDTVRAGDQDRFEVAAASLGNPAVSARAEATTLAFLPWQTETPMPTPRYRLAAANLPGDFYYYAIGGLGGDTWAVALGANERYDTCTGRWDAMAPMPTPRGNVSAAVIDGKIYVPGGYAAEAHLDVLEIYDPASDSWSSGAAMPEPLSGMAVAAYGGKLYTFGGSTPEGGLTNKTLVYDPAADAWQEKTPLPGGARGFAAAATLNARIYVAGGWYVNTVEVYDPATDTWSTAAPMNQARQSPGMIAAPDGWLYVSGGGTDTWSGLDSTERYDPALNRWQTLLPLEDANRAGSAAAYAGGRIYAVGGVDSALSSSNESLQLFSSFCQSTKRTLQDITYPFESPIQAPSLLPVSPPHPLARSQDVETGTRITYTITLYSDDSTLDAASVTDPIPQGTTFGGFGDNAAGATYDAAQNRVLWSGEIPSNSPPLSFTFGINVDLAEWHNGDVIVNEATLNNGAGIAFTRTAASLLNFPDPSPSSKTVSKSWATTGDRLTYTLQIRNPSPISDVITLVDPIPAHTTYVPGSLSYGTGSGTYDEEAQAIRWAGILPALIAYRVVGYDWGDSNGGGTVPGVTPDWHDMSGATDTGVSSDDGTFGTFPIGFAFDYWGAMYETFYVSPNGWVGFSSELGSIVSCSDYGTSGTPNNFIGGFGGDRAVFGYDDASIVYKLFGAAPNRRLVVQFTNIRYNYYSDADTLDMQIVLYEGSREILMQYRDLTTSPTTTATGLEGPGPDYPHRLYDDACPSEIQEGLAVLFRPRLAPTMGHDTDVSYAVTVDASTPGNTWITNTATLSSSFVSVQREAGTLIDPVDLSTSTKSAPVQVTASESISYTLLLHNTGVGPASEATLDDPIPPHTTYAPGSLACSSGACTYSGIDQVVRWSGSIAPSGTVTLTFAVTLTESLADRTPITNTATLEDGYGSTHTLRAVTLARTPDLSGSFKQAVPGTVSDGGTVTYTIYVHNAGVIDTVGEVRDALPPELTYVPDSLSCGAGACSYDEGVITWEGAVRGKSVVPVRFQATVSAATLPGQQVTNRATVRDRTTGQSFSISASARIPGMAHRTFYLPIAAKDTP